MQMQLVDSMLVLHNIDDKSSQVYDIKLSDYQSPLIQENLDLDTAPAKKGFYYCDMIYEDERL